MAGKWVNWFKLANPSLRQTVADVKRILVAKGLSDGEKATPKAYTMKMAKKIDGKEVWNLTRFVSMCRNDRRAAKEE